MVCRFTFFIFHFLFSTFGSTSRTLPNISNAHMSQVFHKSIKIGPFHLLCPLPSFLGNISPSTQAFLLLKYALPSVHTPNFHYYYFYLVTLAQTLVLLLPTSKYPVLMSNLFAIKLLPLKPLSETMTFPASA